MSQLCARRVRPQMKVKRTAGEKNKHIVKLHKKKRHEKRQNSEDVKVASHFPLFRATEAKYLRKE